MLPANPLAKSSRAVRTAAASSQRSSARKQQAKRNPTLTYAERHGVVVVKCCLQLSALTVIDTSSMSIVPTRRVSSDSDSDESARSSSSSGDEMPDLEEYQLRRKKAESAYYDDISLLRLDARRPLLYADLMAEVHRLHGPLLLAILMQEGAKGVVRISYPRRRGRPGQHPERRRPALRLRGLAQAGPPTDPQAHLHAAPRRGRIHLAPV
jgi:hypothetical protein